MLIFPFLYPIGLDAIKPLKMIFVLWQLAASIYIILMFLIRVSKHREKNTFIWCVIIYHILLLMITLIKTGGISEGLRKVFIAPIACIACVLLCRKDCIVFIKTILYIIFVEEILNLVLWNVKIFQGDQFLLGIRTDFPVYGMIGLFVSIICLHFKIQNTKLPSILTVLSVAFSMILSWVSTGIMVLFTIIVLMYFVNAGKFEKCFKFITNNKLVPLAILLNIGVVFFNIQYYFSYLIQVVLGESLLLNGRTIIWEQALPLIKNSLIFGYGVYGTNIVLPDWWGATLNYTHNQLLQLLLDGGLVAAVAFLLIIVFGAKEIDRCTNYFVLKQSTIFLFCINMTFIVESYANYLCFYILLGIIVESWEIARCCDMKKSKLPTIELR